MLMTLASCASLQGAPGKDGVTPTIEISEDGYWVINGTKTEIKAAGTNGADGKDGKDGKDGVDGIDGEDGIDGDDGAPGENGIDGETPTIEISDDGYWVINGTKTEYKAIGVDGSNGDNGVTPTIDISDDGYWIINGTKTEYKAIGVDGSNGDNGVTPTIDISEDGYWIINGTKTEYKAIGVDGSNGDNGVTPTIDISEDGYWIINGVKTDKKAIGVDGENGENGSNGTNGTNGVGIASTTMDENGNIVITYTDGTVEVIEHNWVYTHTVKAPSCTETGIALYSCEDCGLARVVVTDALGHSWNTVTTPPTCQAGGYDTKTCATCGEVEVCNATPMIAHEYSNEYVSNNSFHWKKCNTCDKTSENAEHTLGDDGICIVCDTPIGDTEGIIYSLSTDRTYAMVVIYAGTATKLKIASEYQGVPVTRISNYAFEKCTSITSITIPDSVTSIGNYAFRGCTGLTSITIPDYVTSIGNYAFYGCTGLTSITIPDSVTSIGDYAFSSCTALTSIEVDENNQYYEAINENLYTKNGKMLLSYAIAKKDTSFIIPDSVTSIGNGAFRGCTALTSITIPASVTSIGDYAFYECTSLSSVVIPDSVTNIGEYAFLKCNSSLYAEYEYGKYVRSRDNSYAVLIEITDPHKSTYTIHENTKYIAGGVFKNLILTSITIPDSVTNIGEFAFYGSSLRSVVIPDSVTTIGSSAFSKCSNLGSVVIGNSVTNIGSSAFSGCSNLSTVVIPDSVISIGNSAFSGCYYLGLVVIGNSVTNIGESAFYNSGLGSVVIGNSVTNIGESAFTGTNLESVVIPDSVTSIGYFAFSKCYRLTNITYEGTVSQWTNIYKGGGSEIYEDIQVVCYDGTVTIYCDK